MRGAVTAGLQTWAAALSALSAFGALACTGGASPSNHYAVLVRASDSVGQPLSHVSLSAAGVELGETDASGQRVLSLPGTEGARMDLSAACPVGYTGPRERPAFLLERVRDGRGQLTDDPIVVSLTCDASSHVALVAVQTGEPGLQITREGRPLARTSSTGTAHVMLREAPGTTVELTLDTREKPELQPPNPTRTFVVTRQDAFSVWDQAFEREAKKRAPSRKRRKSKAPSAVTLPPPEPR